MPRALHFPMHRLLLLVFLVACAAPKKSPWEQQHPFNVPNKVTRHPVSRERVLPSVDVLAEGRTSLRAAIKLPSNRRIAGPLRFRVSELAGPVSFRPENRRFSLAEPRLSFNVPFSVKEGLAEFRFVAEYTHCPRKGEGDCATEQSYYRVTMNAKKGRGVSYVPVTITP